MSTDPAPFEITGPLPSGVTVLEASAGTGKTHAITGLAARYVAEGTPLERILAVTFTRMATGELRERVRERLVAVERELRRRLAGGPPRQDEDAVVELLAAGDAQSAQQARARLARALSDFDAATIATTHGFCQEALGGLGIAADLEPGVEFVEDLSDLVSEVLDDLYIRRFHREAKPAMTRGQALAIAQLAVANPGAPIAPASGELSEMRRRLAVRVREELDERKRRLSVMTYDDLLMRLRQALDGPGGAAVAGRLRDRYEVVLVDEFQDTDPVQWDIMRLAFGQSRALVLIADPKQAIYAFRGADVYAYIQAADQARTRQTLTINRRSDQPLLDAYDALFGNAKLGHEAIAYRRVSAAARSRPPRLHGAALRIRVLERGDVACTPNGFARAPAAREHIAEDLAGDVTALLDSDAEVAVREPGAASAAEPVCPGHLAVLVRTNNQAALVREALERAGVPAVINGAGSVFATESATAWLTLLEALEQPASVSRAHAATLTPFLGWEARRVAHAPDSDWEALHERLHEFSRVLRSSGVAALVETITRRQRLPERVLSRADGERRLTDIRHVGQLLHAAATSEQLGTTALTGWLRRRMLEAARDGGEEERSRRLESDAEAVQVLTIHRSKGLEFPIVYAPFLWDAAQLRDGEPVTFHDPESDHRRTLDVSLGGEAFRSHREQSVVEQRGEDLRLAYVALTRARHQAVLWWAGSKDSRNSPLGRLVFLRRPDGSVPAYGSSTPSDAAALDTFRTLAAQAPRLIEVELSKLGAPAWWRPLPGAGAELAAARFARTLDHRWRRTSYSDITAAAHDAAVASEPEEPALSDEPDVAVAMPADGETASSATAVRSLLEALPVGVAAGTLVHQALEATDFAAVDLDAELERALETVPGRRSVALEDVPGTVAGLRAAIETPLGPLLGEAALRDVTRVDRLDELGFELPLAGGETPTGTLALAAVRKTLVERLPDGDPLRAYARRLDDHTLRQTVRGYLTGSLDLVVRFGAPHAPRFAVVDYKTNWLGEVDEPLSAWHYRPRALTSEMHERHYALQALLYLVALHRYLRWRLPGYDPARQLAGVLYLFVRGMSGPDTPIVEGERCGIFAWEAKPGLVEALSDALDAGAPLAGAPA